jgi:NitT/TauT family transport system substrate-binding protein
MLAPAKHVSLLSMVLVVVLAACAPAASPAPAKSAPAAAAPSAATAAPAAPVAAAPAPAQPAAAPETVSVGWVRSINIAPFFVAQRKGYYTQEGLAIETAEFRSAADIVGALGTGQLDVNAGTISAGTFNAWQRGVKMIVGAPTSVYPAEGLMPTNVITRKELFDSGAVKTAADFRGRKVSINVRGGINEVVLMLVLARRGLAVEDVELVTMPFPDMIAALANGSVDVITPPDPFGAQALEQGVGVRLDDDQWTVGAIQPTHYLFSENFAVNRADVAVRFIMATMRAAREMQGNWLADPTLARIIEDETGIKQEILVRSVLPEFSPEMAVRTADVNLLQDAFLGLGHLSYATPIDVTPFVNTTLSAQAKQRLDARR